MRSSLNYYKLLLVIFIYKKLRLIYWLHQLSLGSILTWNLFFIITTFLDQTFSFEPIWRNHHLIRTKLWRIMIIDCTQIVQLKSVWVSKFLVFWQVLLKFYFRLCMFNNSSYWQQFDLRHLYYFNFVCFNE